MAKGATIDQLVKAGVGTKAGLESLGFKDSPKKITPKKDKPKNLAESVMSKGKTQRLPLSSKVPLKSTLSKSDINKSEALRLKAEGLKLKGQGMKLKGQALAQKGKKQYYKEQYHQNLMDKAIKGQNLTVAENRALYEKLNNKLDSGKKLTDREAKARKATLNTAIKKGREDFTETAITVATLLATRGRSGVRGQAPKLLSKGKDLISSGVKQLTTKGGRKLIGQGTKELVKKGATSSKKAIGNSSKIERSLGDGMNLLKERVNPSTVRSTSQKLLGNSQKMLKAPAKGLAAPKGSITSRVASKGTKLSEVASKRSASRVAKIDKLNSKINTTNKAARKMRLQDEVANLSKKGTQRLKNTYKANKAKNAKPKPGDQLKFDFRKGGKISYGRSSKKK